MLRRYQACTIMTSNKKVSISQTLLRTKEKYKQSQTIHQLLKDYSVNKVMKSRKIKFKTLYSWTNQLVAY
jgi:hypothetical protein